MTLAANVESLELRGVRMVQEREAVLPAASGRNALSYAVAASCGAVLMVTPFFLWASSDSVPLTALCAIGFGALWCVFGFVALVRGVWLRTQDLKKCGRTSDMLESSRRNSRWIGFATLLIGIDLAGGWVTTFWKTYAAPVHLAQYALLAAAAIVLCFSSALHLRRIG